jgi:hypothetical protein
MPSDLTEYTLNNIFAFFAAQVWIYCRAAIKKRALPFLAKPVRIG